MRGGGQRKAQIFLDELEGNHLEVVLIPSGDPEIAMRGGMIRAVQSQNAKFIMSETDTIMCNRCNKPSDFYRRKNGDLVRPCKGCMKTAAMEWAKSHPEQTKKTMADFRQRHRAAIRVRDRQRIAESPEANRQRVKVWKDGHPVEHRAQVQRWVGSNPERVAIAQSASNSVRKAIRAGILVRSTHCENCGTESAHIEASHDDYLKPLEVQWLCRSCHRRKDAQNPRTVIAA